MARWQGGKVARLQGCKVARWQGGKVARWQGGRLVRALWLIPAFGFEDMKALGIAYLREAEGGEARERWRKREMR